jgi:hypothetical protein
MAKKTEAADKAKQPGPSKQPRHVLRYIDPASGRRCGVLSKAARGIVAKAGEIADEYAYANKGWVEAVSAGETICEGVGAILQITTTPAGCDEHKISPDYEGKKDDCMGPDPE